MSPKPATLILLGASVRGLPVSEAPVLEVCPHQTTGLPESDEMAVEWDGGWPLLFLDNNRERPCVLRGDFAVVVRFGGRYKGRWWCWASTNRAVCGLIRILM